MHVCLCVYIQVVCVLYFTFLATLRSYSHNDAYG